MFTFFFYITLTVFHRLGPTLISGATEGFFVSYDSNHRFELIGLIKLQSIKNIKIKR